MHLHLRSPARRRPLVRIGSVDLYLSIFFLFIQVRSLWAMNNSGSGSIASSVKGLLQHTGSREGCELLESTTPCSSIAPGSCLQQLAYSGNAEYTKLVPVGGPETKSPDALCCSAVRSAMQQEGMVQVFEDDSQELQFFVRPYEFSRTVEVTIHPTGSLPTEQLCSHSYSVVEGEAFGIHSDPSSGQTVSSQPMPWDTLHPMVFLAIIFGIVLGGGLLCLMVGCLSRWRKTKEDVAKVDAYLYALRALEDQAGNRSPAPGLRHMDSLSPVHRNMSSHSDL